MVRRSRSRSKPDKSAPYVGKEFGSRPASKQPPMSQPETSVADVDLELREYLRGWRRGTAKKQSTPAHVVLHDTSLGENFPRPPSPIAELLSVTGIGERKAEMYCRAILAALKRIRGGAP